MNDSSAHPSDRRDESREATGEQESLEVLRDRVRAWWTQVLAGQIDQAHPVQGGSVKAHLDGDTLVITGSVPSEADRQAIAAEVEHLRRNGVNAVRNELKAAPRDDEQPGLLVQTLIGAFETAEQAGFAEGYLQGHAHVDPRRMLVVAADADEDARAALRSVLPNAYQQKAQQALAAGRSVLVVTVDETEAFQARELLDEETRSLETIVLPPEPIERSPMIHAGLQRGAGSRRTAGMQRADAAKAEAAGAEERRHER
ncbi:MAG TPA: hypothetical protein VFD32_17100 [Dehalococcoidia bacterium]|nr:hypothetical protein [Dehalococcoidia bacterium]